MADKGEYIGIIEGHSQRFDSKFELGKLIDAAKYRANRMMVPEMFVRPHKDDIAYYKKMRFFSVPFEKLPAILDLTRESYEQNPVISIRL